MTLRRIKIALILILAVMLSSTIYAQWEDSLTDANGAKTIIANDSGTPTQPVAIYGDPTTHALMIIPATASLYFATPEWDVATVSGSSGTDLNPLSESYGFCFQNATASSVFMKLGSAADNWDGLRIEAGGNRCLWGIVYSTFTVYAPVSATMTVEHWRY